MTGSIDGFAKCSDLWRRTTGSTSNYFFKARLIDFQFIP